MYEYGELNQSKLMSYCGLNNVKHREILDGMVKNELIIRKDTPWGNKMTIIYSISEKGRTILQNILGPYEELFPRKEAEDE